MTALKTPNSRVSYVASLELASTHKLSSAFAVTEFDEEAAKVVDGSTVSFIGGVPKLQQQDVLNSTLLAQLAANKAHDREKATEQWYTKYREVLENIGWIVQNFSFQRQNDSGTTVRLDKTALSIFAAAASGNELAVLTATLEALENQDPDSKAITLFDSSGSSGESGNFQLGTCSMDPTGNVQMTLGAFYFQADEHKKRFLFFSWSTKEINIYLGTQNVLLNEAIYATVRQAVIEKLGDAAQTYVANIEI